MDGHCTVFSPPLYKEVKQTVERGGKTGIQLQLKPEVLHGENFKEKQETKSR
jgi:hypothetical protein